MTKNFRKFLLLWGASFISATGSGMTSFALGIYVYQLTGLSSWTGLLLLFGFLPGLVLAPLAGILADRHDRRLLMMLGDGLSIIGLVTIILSIFFLQSKIDIAIGIGIGVAISSSFAALVEPSFRSTVSDLLDKEEYSQASGMVQIVSSAKYLLSPVIATFVLSISDIQTIILFDIATILLTLPVTYLVRKQMTNHSQSIHTSIRQELKEGFRLVHHPKGIWYLVLLGIWISFYIGAVQILMTPMILGFSNETFLGFATTFSACGMLATGGFLSYKKVKKHHVAILNKALVAVGGCMILFAMFKHPLTVCLFGFAIFAALPFANMAMDYLVRITIPSTQQGKVWGVIGLISQLGYVGAYILIGPITDYLISPLMSKNGLLATSIGTLVGTGDGRGAAVVIMLSGVLMIVTITIFGNRSEIKMLEVQHHVLEIIEK